MSGDRTQWPSGDRFSVRYLLWGDEAEAHRMAEDICYEQTVEFPQDLVPAGVIKDHVVGRIESVRKIEVHSYRAEISFAIETTAFELTQLLNVVFGNISIKPAVKVERLILPDRLLSAFDGPRFGRRGLRELLRVFDRPLVCTALKPMGLSNGDLARRAYQFAKGGIDLIKDDHGLTDQPFAPFEERVVMCAEAVAKANSETGGTSLYVPNITAAADKIFACAAQAKKLGAGALLICPGLVGMDTMRVLADDDSIGLPILAHPAFLGSFVTSDRSGFTHRALYGQIMRLAGADVTIFPNYGGRFSFTKGECGEIVEGANEPMGGIAPIFPAPGGGMTADRVPEMREVYGKDFVALMGGGLYRQGPDLAENGRHFLRAIESTERGR